MAKTSGLGDNFYISGYDLSGDLASLDSISAPMTPIDVTAIKQLAHARIGGLRTGLIQFTTFFESTHGVSNPAVPGSTVPYVSTYNFPVQVTVIGGTGTQVSINGVNQGSFDGTYTLPALGTIILTYSVVPTWNWFALGAEHEALSPLSRLDQIATYFRGTTIGNPSACMQCRQVNYDPTRDNVGNLTLKVELDGDYYGLEWGQMMTGGLRTDTTATTGPFFDGGAGTAFGASAYLQLVEIVGTSVDVTVQHATTSGGSYTTLMDFGAQAAIGGFRQSVSNVTTVNEFIKIVTTGTFSVATFAVTLVRYPVAGVVF
jgi:hypothetical protein